MGFLNDVEESLKYARTPQTPARICPDCGVRAEGQLVNKGHFIVELVLWLVAWNWAVLLFPVAAAGVFSIWRRTNRDYGCEYCGGRMIPVASPRGKALLEQYRLDETLDRK